MELSAPAVSLAQGPVSSAGLSALAHLAVDDPASAARDVRAALRLAEALSEEPVLITALVRIALTDSAMQALWEGLTRHEWSEPQLEQIEGVLKRANFVKEMAQCLRASAPSPSQ